MELLVTHSSFSVIFKYIITTYIFLLSYTKCSRKDETEVLLNRQHFGDQLDEYDLLISSLRQSARRQMLGRFKDQILYGKMILYQKL